MRQVTAFYILFMSFLFPLSSVAADEGRFYVSVDGGYKTGDFGTSTRSDLYYLSSDIGYLSPGYEVSATVPYLSLTNRTEGESSKETGIGDIILRGGKTLLPETDSGLSVNGALAVKLPTADDSKGLGTGKADYGAFLSLHQRFDTIKLTLMTGYIKVGDLPSINLNDVFLYGIGISRSFSRTDIYASLEGRRAVVHDADNPLEVNLGFFHALSASYSIRASTFFGLNDGGPDFGLSTGIARWF